MRTFAIDVLRCDCGGVRAVISTITDPSVVSAFLAAIDVTVPELETLMVRAPPEGGVGEEARRGVDPAAEDGEGIRFVPDAG